MDYIKYSQPKNQKTKKNLNLASRVGSRHVATGVSSSMVYTRFELFEPAIKHGSKLIPTTIYNSVRFQHNSVLTTCGVKLTPAQKIAKYYNLYHVYRSFINY